MEKAKQREREHEIVYERKLAKERDRDQHLYEHKDKFITSGYKRQLAEQAKWIEKERLRDMLEQKEDVTKKKDMTDFYFGLHKNVAFGGGDNKWSDEVSTSSAPGKEHLSRDREPESSSKVDFKNEKDPPSKDRDTETKPSSKVDSKPHGNDDGHLTADSKPVSASQDDNNVDKPQATEQQNKNHHKRSQDALAEAKQRFLTRKKTKEQQVLD